MAKKLRHFGPKMLGPKCLRFELFGYRWDAAET